MIFFLERTFTSKYIFSLWSATIIKNEIAWLLWPSFELIWIFKGLSIVEIAVTVI